ncbi:MULTISPECIES: MCE family protein [Rhodococcus]|uniref:MCE family protein n=1 Tax=Rhodococcus TaxID=1827 RepID=UPI002235FA04|nr:MULTISPECIES: MCE family protein [Rhodococcus]MDI9941322.1 MCE family protein [Rhodococcus sp. IEGM 1351]MDJ0418546.1 MCE family protein [Rhodococcus opacus]UZG52823.1 MCE family protein [Rhodococcus opacus]
MNARHPGLKLTVFIAVTSLITAALVMVVGDIRLGPSRTYSALFASASGLKSGDDVKVSGVPVGKVSDVQLAATDSVSEVSFSMSEDIALSLTSTAAIKYKNLIGDRYLELTVLPDGRSPRGEHDPIPVAQTTAALDIDTLVNGFRPLLEGLDPDQTNRLSASIIEVLNGRQESIGTLVEQLGSLGNALADRDEVIGNTVDNLNTVLTTVDGRRDQFGTLVTELQQLTTGLSADRDTLTRALEQLDNASAETQSVLEQARPPLQADIEQLSRTAANLNSRTDTLNLTLGKLPEMYRLVGRNTGYGSFLNFFVCGLAIRYPGLNGPETTPMFTAPAERCK